MLFRPQGLLGMKEISFVGLWDRLLAFVAGRRKKRLAVASEKSEKGDE